MMSTVHSTDAELSAEESSLTESSTYKQQPCYKWRKCALRELTRRCGVMKCETAGPIQYSILNVSGSRSKDFLSGCGLLTFAI